MNGFVKLIAPILALGTIAAIAAPSMADDHSINARLHRQDVRIHQGVRDHDLNKYQAHALHARDHRLHTAEVRDRRHDHGHLTVAERAHLEHRLNHDSRVINERKHR